MSQACQKRKMRKSLMAYDRDKASLRKRRDWQMPGIRAWRCDHEAPDDICLRTSEFAKSDATGDQGMGILR